MKYKTQVFKLEVTTESNVENYTRRLRNAAKRNYAKRWGAWRQQGEQGLEPEPIGLSYMAAQAVRMNVALADECDRKARRDEEV